MDSKLLQHQETLVQCVKKKKIATFANLTFFDYFDGKVTIKQKLILK
jgi:hypothetical protein